VRMVGEGDYDVVLMDVQMPVMDGIAATKAIRAEERFADLPIVAMTANALVSDRERCLEAGMNDHVAKPIDPEDLFTKLTRWVKPRERAATAPVKPAKPDGPGQRSASVSAQEVPGVDLAGALRRLGGNRRLLDDLLGKFAAQQGGAATQVSAALESGERKVAERVAHTVKGVAANLGMTALASDAEKLERAIREGTTLAGLVEAFGSRLGQQVAVIRTAFGASGDVAAGAEAKGAFNAEAARAAASRLRRALKASDAEAADAVAELATSLGNGRKSVKLDALRASVSDFEFEKALLELDEIEKEYDLVRAG